MTSQKQQEPAPFHMPDVEFSEESWGPHRVPEKFRDMPFAPINKGDRLGKVADFGGFLNFTNRMSLVFMPQMVFMACHLLLLVRIQAILAGEGAMKTLKLATNMIFKWIKSLNWWTAPKLKNGKVSDNADDGRINDKIHSFACLLIWWLCRWCWSWASHA